VKLDRAQGRFTTEQRLWVSVDWSAAPKGREIEASIDVESSGGNRRVIVPAFNPVEPLRDTVTGFVESHGCVSMDAEHFTRRSDRDGAAWQVIQGLGRSGDSVSVFHRPCQATPSRLTFAHTAVAGVRFLPLQRRECQLQIDGTPTQPVAPGRGVRLAISVDGSEPQVTGDRPRSSADVLANLRAGLPRSR